MDIWSTLFLVFVLVIVMVGAYYTTKFLSGKARQISKSKHIHVIDRMGIAKDKALFLTKVGGKCFFIGVTNQAVSTLGELDPKDIENIASEEPEAEKSVFGRFSDFLANAKNAPESLRKAREAHKRGGDPQPSGRAGVVDDDYIDQISRAIQQRKGRAERPKSPGEDR